MSVGYDGAQNGHRTHLEENKVAAHDLSNALK
jgi:hypothetical protein